jgi:uncharacterized protein (TIGR03435 family)
VTDCRVSASRALLLIFLGIVVKPMPALGQQAVLPAKPALTFDVVSIKPNRSDSPNYVAPFPAGVDGLLITNVNLFSIMKFAYDFWREDLISAVPGWIKTERSDIRAKVAGADVDAWKRLNDDQRRIMLQEVLADSFKLKIHWEPKEIPVYQMVIAKNGPKFKAAKPDEDSGLKGPDGKPMPGILHTGQGQFTAQDAPMSALATTLSDYSPRQVVDRTGLEGGYDFTLQFAPEPGYGPEYRHRTESPVPDAVGPSVFTAVQEQLGLKLEPAKTLENGLVIDSVERPAAN